MTFDPDLVYRPTHEFDAGRPGGRRCVVEVADGHDSTGWCGLLEDEHANPEDLGLGRTLERAEILVTLRGLLSEFKAGGAGTAAIAAVGRAIRDVEARGARQDLATGSAVFPPPARDDEVLEPDAQGFLTTAYERNR